MKRQRIKSKNNTNTTFRTKSSLIKEQNELKKKIKKLKSAIQKEQKNTLRSENTKMIIQEIEKTLKKNGITNQLEYNSVYNLLINNKKNSTSSEKNKIILLKLESDLMEIEKEIEQYKPNIKKNNKTKKALIKELNNSKIQNKSGNIILKQKKTNPPSISNSFEVDWDNIFFENKKIVIRHNNQWHYKYIPESNKFLNEIKHYYKFHNVPKLKVQIKEDTFIIQNQEVLFYHIDFLNITASNYGYLQLPKLNIEKWKKYNKQYYKTYLSFLLHTHTLKKLCEYSDPKSPIIPVGEAVINSNGSSIIHSSFLFPIKSKTGYLLIWESIEEGKASYVFSINSFSNKSKQDIFNYIAGKTQNKRSSLLSSRDLQNKLNMKGRILHTDLNSWEMEIKQLVKN